LKSILRKHQNNNASMSVLCVRTYITWKFFEFSRRIEYPSLKG